MRKSLNLDYRQACELRSLLYVVIVALMIRSFIFELFYVPTGSMKLTILEGDYVFSTKYSYGYNKYSLPLNLPLPSGRILKSDPQRGDIVIFRPPHQMNIRYIKRLVGMPGDKIQLINDIIYINDRPIGREKLGQVQDEQGQIYQRYKETLPNGVTYIAYKLTQDEENQYLSSKLSNTEPFYVPKNKYFFLGDNRDQSNDSRIDLGFVPFENFIAKAQFILCSIKEPLWLEGGQLTQIVTRAWTWISSVRTMRMFRDIYNLD